MLITGKYHTRVMTLKDPGLIFSSNDQADEVNKRFVTVYGLF